MLGLAGVGSTVSPQLVEASVAKIVAWTSDIRSAEVRKASQDTLYALFSLHPGEVTRLLSALPKVCQVGLLPKWLFLSIYLIILTTG